jgi:COP9 signalosome complex subunit 6
VFPSYELLGWYSTGESVTADDAALHAQVTAFNEAPIFLQLALSPSAAMDASSKTLPLAVYMAEYHGSSFAFARLPYKIETSEPERVTTDHVLNVAAQRGAGENESSCECLLSARATHGCAFAVLL